MAVSLGLDGVVRGVWRCGSGSGRRHIKYNRSAPQTAVSLMYIGAARHFTYQIL